MSHYIAEPCIGTKDTSCVAVCPVDCIVQYQGDASAEFPNQLYIDPEECINCGVCEPGCPFDAIFEDEQVPTVFEADTVLNARIVDVRDQFEVPEKPARPTPSPRPASAGSPTIPQVSPSGPGC